MHNTIKYEKLFLLTLILGGFTTTLATSTVNIALPEFMTVFGTNLDVARWTITGFMLTTGIMAPITSFLGEKFSYKWMFFAAICGFVVSSLGCMWAPSIELLVFFRILQGVFNGLTMPTTMAIIYQILPKERQPLAMSLWSFALMIAPALGPTIGGWLIEYFSWKGIFFINLPLGIVTLVLITFTVPFYRLKPPAAFDSLGFASSILATTTLLVGFSNVSLWGWTSPKTIGLIAAGLLFLVLFIYRETGCQSPVLDLKIFRNPFFTLSIVIRGVVIMALYAGSLLTPLFLQSAQHASALSAGLVLLIPSFMMALSTILIGKLYTRMDPLVLVRIGIVSLAFGSFLLARTTIETTHLYIIIALIFRNVGIALSLTTVTMVGMASLKKELAGNGSSINNWVSQSIGCFSISFFTSILSLQRTRHFTELRALLPAGDLQALVAEKALVAGINDVYFLSVFVLVFALAASLMFQPKNDRGARKGQALVAEGE